MKLVTCFVACLSISALAQTVDPAKVYERRAGDALDRERARSGAHLCGHTDDGSDYTVGNCWLRESHTTDAHYTDYVRALGALLRQRLAEAGPHPQLTGPAGRIPFDDAEATWLVYRKQSCMTMIDQWAGGTVGRVAYPRCLVTSTWTHMDDLNKLYNDL